MRIERSIDLLAKLEAEFARGREDEAPWIAALLVALEYARDDRNGKRERLAAACERLADEISADLMSAVNES